MSEADKTPQFDEKGTSTFPAKKSAKEIKGILFKLERLIEENEKVEAELSAKTIQK